MRAFVIKNKEGEYLEEGKDMYGEDTMIWHKDIVYADIYSSKGIAEMKLEPFYRDCKVIEITIVEGNFDTYIDKLQDERDFERRDKTYIVKQLNDPNDYVIREDYIELEQRNRQLEEKLAEKNKEIGELKHYIYSYNNEINNRPQICNEYIDATCRDILDKMKELKL